MRRIFTIFILLLATSSFLRAEPTFEVGESEIGADGVQRLTMIADSYFYSPNYLVVRVGIPVELVITRRSAVVPHSFVLKIPEAGVDITESISTKGTKITFTPTVVGRFPFFCDKKLPFLPSHREHGMEGVLEVRP